MIPRFGRAADFAAVLREAAAAGGAHHLHHGHNPRITFLSDDAAEGRWDIQRRGPIASPRTIIRTAGTYDDLSRSEAGTWRIAAMRMRRTSSVSETIDPDATSRIAALPEGNSLHDLFSARNA